MEVQRTVALSRGTRVHRAAEPRVAAGRCLRAAAERVIVGQTGSMSPGEWEVLDGLPVYGAAAVPFSATGLGTHREGLVVRFKASSGDWVGNFQRGLTSSDHVVLHPDGRHVLVIAGGTAHVVDPETQILVTHFGGGIEHVILLADGTSVLLSNGLWFEALEARGTVWKSRRISWDGFRNVSLDGTFVRGEAYAPEGIDGTWYPFAVDVRTGEVTGGSYGRPPM